jgi:hypothetical protein
MLQNRRGREALLLLALAPAATRVAADDPSRPSVVASDATVPAEAAQSQPPPAKKRFEETVEVVAPGSTSATSAAELPVRPAAVMTVAGAADNVFRTLQTLPGVAATTEFDSRIAVRGGSPDENLTIMDGVEIHNPYRLFGLTSAFNPETVSRFDLYAGAFSAKYGDRLSSLLVVENRPGSDAGRLHGSTALSLTDANAIMEGRLPGAGTGSWIVTARRTYYDLVANSLVNTELPAFGDLQGRLDWNLRPGTRLSLFGLLSREATDAFFEDDRPGEQLALATTARNDLGALELATRIAALSSRTTLSFYVNRDRIDADARLRNEARRSNAPSDEVGFGLADVDFTRELEVRDLALRQELVLAKADHLLESGFEVHQLQTGTVWRIEGERNPTADNGSSVQGGAGLPSDLDSAVDSTRVGAWLVDRWQANARFALEAGLRFDWSGVNRRTTFSPRLAATWRLGEATRLRAAGGLFTQSPGYEKLVQSDYFLDLSGDLGRSLRHERAVHAVLGIERELAPGVSARLEAYWKDLDDLIVGRLETEAERLARVSQYDFPPELVSSVPASPIITSYPANGAAGRSWGFDVLLQKRPTPGARLTGWASYTWGRASRDEYGRDVAFDYDRRHAASVVASWRFSPRWELAATARAFSGFPTTPVLGLRVAADEAEDGRLVPALDAEGRYVYETDSGDVSNLNTARLPAFFRLDLRLSWTPRGDAGRWLFYVDVINATNRENAGQIEPRLDYDPASPLDQPRLLLEPAAAIPFLPSVGVRFRF